MEIYLVGGAVRDFLLAKLNGKLQNVAEEEQYWLQVEKDWVVVGSTPEEMLKLNFRQVGKSFPVFLHPKTQEEYALARTERKIDKGYTGFECYASPEVTLEEDLKRRDLTINAMAMRIKDQNFLEWELIDPYHGMSDLKNQVFRHISPAFAEDPVRILRIARLASRFSEFRVAKETLGLMNNMVKAGEVDALVPERVWQELSRALSEQAPWRFFQILEACGAKQKLFPEIINLSLKQIAISKAIQEQESDIIRFALLTYDLSELDIKHICAHLHIPNEFKELSMMVANFYDLYLDVLQVEPEKLLNLLEKCDAFRRQERFLDFIKTCYILDTTEASLAKEFDFETNRKESIKRAKLLEQSLNAVLKINNQDLLNQGLKGKEFADALRKLRIEILSNI